MSSKGAIGGKGEILGAIETKPELRIDADVLTQELSHLVDAQVQVDGQDLALYAVKRPAGVVLWQQELDLSHRGRLRLLGAVGEGQLPGEEDVAQAVAGEGQGVVEAVPCDGCEDVVVGAVLDGGEVLGAGGVLEDGGEDRHPDLLCGGAALYLVEAAAEPAELEAVGGFGEGELDEEGGGGDDDGEQAPEAQGVDDQEQVDGAGEEVPLLGEAQRMQVHPDVGQRLDLVLQLLPRHNGLAGFGEGNQVGLVDVLAGGRR